MATIPSNDDLGYQNPTGVERSVRTPDMQVNRESYVPRTAMQGNKEMGERIANEEFAKAEVQFQIGSMQETKKADDDSDIDGVEERYEAAMIDQLGKASAGITSAKARELFMIRGQEALAKNNYNMNKKTTAKKNDREKGYMANAIDAMVKGGMDLEYGDPGEAALGIQLSLDSMVERGVISNVEAQGINRKAMSDMAYGRLKAMDPEQQMEILNSTDPKAKKWLDEIPPDVLRGLREQAESQGEDGVAHKYAMGLRGMDEGSALDQMYEQSARENWDQTLIDKTYTRIRRLAQDDERIHQEKLNDYHEEGIDAIFYGDTTLDQMRKSPEARLLIKEMTPAQRLNLERADDNAVKRAAGEGRKYSERPVVDELKRLMVNKQPQEMRKYFSEHYAELSDAHFNFFNQASSPTKSKMPEFSPIRTANQLLTAHKKQNKSMTDKEEEDIWERINGQALKYFHDPKTLGQDPPDALVNQWIEEEFIQIRHKKNWWPDEQKFLYQMSDEAAPGEISERRKVVQQMDFIQQATGFNRDSVGKSMAQYAEDHYDFVPRMEEAIVVVRRRHPDEEPFQHWARIKRMLKLDKPVATDTVGVAEIP